MAEYFIKVRDQYNRPLTTISDYYKLELFRSEYGIGSLYIDIPLDKYLGYGFKTGWRLEVYRRVGDADLVRVGKTQWLINIVRNKVDEQNKTLIHILAYDPITIIDRRIVAYVAGTPYALKKDMPADDMMKAIMRENLGALAVDWRRDLSEWLVIEDDAGQAPKITMDDFAFRAIQPLMNEICEKSLAEGTYLSYDIEYDESIGKLVFKTFTGQRGIDRGSDSNLPLYLSHFTDVVNVRGQGLNYASVEVDATDERTFVYSGRESEDVNAFFGTLANQSAIDDSPLGRFEDFTTTGESTDPNDVAAEAHAWLQHKYRKTVINMHLQQESGLKFGRDYNFGDIVAFRYLGQTFNVHLDEFKIVSDGAGSEAITITSTTLEHEFEIDKLRDPEAAPIIKNEKLEDDPTASVPLFYRYHSVGQAFRSETALKLDYVDVMMRRKGLPQRNVSLTINSDNVNKPGIPLTTPSVVTYDFIPDGLYVWIRFRLAVDFTIAADTQYWIVLSCGVPKSEYNNYYRVGVEKSMRYTKGVMRVSPDGVVWLVNTGAAPPNGEAEDPEETSENADMLFAIGAHQ